MVHSDEPEAEDEQTVERDRPLADRLRDRLGVDVDPGVALPPSELPAAHSVSYAHSTQILKRLKAHGPRAPRYKLTGEIARGGMGAILKVWDEDLRRNLAMKVILGRGDKRAEQPNADDADPKSLGRFMEEAQITGQLDHPGIVPVHELGLDAAGRVFFTMQLVRGRDLNHIFGLAERGEDGWSTARVLEVILKVCDAMAYAHTKGVIHRDLKPANIMIGRFGEVYVMDWGLARVLGREDLTDVRIKTETTKFNLLRAGHDSKIVTDSNDPLRTMDGDVVGTPSFMSPEQAQGRVAELDARTDVYSVGAMLYRLLTQQAPYVAPGAKVTPTAVLLKLLEGPPTRVLVIDPKVPPELAAICEKAMARLPRDRYADMSDLSEDLRAFLDRRVVSAYETGAFAELRKWVARNRGLAAAIGTTVLAAIGGLAAVGYVQAEGRQAADAQRKIADANADQARRERANVMRLSAFQKLEDLQARAETLWPATPELVPEYEAWLERARELVAGLYPDPGGGDPGHYAQRDALRERGLPMSDEELDAARSAHPQHAEWLALKEQLEATRRAHDVRTGKRTATPFALDPARLPEDPGAVNALAWELVQPERLTFGREAEGLALARVALQRARTQADRAVIADTVAWALFANGLDEEALQMSARSLDMASGERQEEIEESAATLRNAVAAAGGGAGLAALRELEAAVAEADALVSQPRAWHFDEDEDRWWHAQLDKLVGEIEAFADEDRGLVSGTSERWGWGIDRRLAFARSVDERTLTGEAARRAWEGAIEAIGDARAFPLYGGLKLTPQRGLVPIGPDPESWLWEFGHPLSGEVPDRDDSGRLVLDEDTCLVFVLLPPGAFAMGAQRQTPEEENYDPLADSGEGPVHEVVLDAFFLSKYEMTQGQWLHVNGYDPSRYDPPNVYAGNVTTLLHPVEQVSWEACASAMWKMGLVLPTEAQWEYAARAMTDTPWWTGDERESLVGHVNIADAAAARGGGTFAAIREWPGLDDGWAVHAHAGAFPANGFGLHETMGNVAEWCREPSASYRLPIAPGDGERRGEHTLNRMFRGGSFSKSATDARSSHRGRFTPEVRYNDLGVRPARAVER